jgi:hypothetical protein
MAGLPARDGRVLCHPPWRTPEVASGWGTVCAVNVLERGDRADLEPLGPTSERGTMRGACPVLLEGTHPRTPLLCTASLRAFEAWVAG